MIVAIKQKLTAQADTSVQRLLPKGKRRGNDWIVGSTRGEEGQSLSVCLSGHKAGLWYDFAEGTDALPNGTNISFQTAKRNSND
ncbi:hypothetical protein LNM86_10105 [Bartonella machadoae]|nr:hypothetical protein [Bartonella machadoae]UNE53921.1 hypothetical protein LNM86_10105 [Bartonella machadoae]